MNEPDLSAPARGARGKSRVIRAARKRRVTLQSLFRPLPIPPAPHRPESLSAVSINDPFWNLPSLGQLAREQRVRPIDDPMAALAASFWADEDEDDFIGTLARWRRAA